jgi:hypothetical protein
MLYKSASTSSSPDKRLGVLTLIAGRRGAELVREARLGRAVERGVEFDIVGDTLALRSPRWGSLDEFDERVRFDLARGRTATSCGLSILIQIALSEGGPAPCRIVGSSQLLVAAMQLELL